MRDAAVRTGSAIVTARAPKARAETIEGITLTHGDRALWPGDQEPLRNRCKGEGKRGLRHGGISKRDLVQYWQQVADHALPGLAKRPLAIVRCPEGVDGEHFFQKHAHGTMPAGVRDGVADKAPFLAIDDLQGLVAMAQMSAVELHVWGATEADPLHADQLVFDLDPGEGVRYRRHCRRSAGFAGRSWRRSDWPRSAGRAAAKVCISWCRFIRSSPGTGSAPSVRASPKG